jgi:hypothetical protein
LRREAGGGGAGPLRRPSCATRSRRKRGRNFRGRNSFSLPGVRGMFPKPDRGASTRAGAASSKNCGARAFAAVAAQQKPSYAVRKSAPLAIENCVAESRQSRTITGRASYDPSIWRPSLPSTGS